MGTPFVANLGSAQFGSSDPLQDGQSWSRYEIMVDQTSTIVNATRYWKVARAGNVIELRAAVTESIPTGTGTTTIDLQKSTGGGAFASMLSSTLVLNSSSTLLVDQTANLSTTTIAKGDTLKLTVTIFNGTGGPGAGLSIGVLMSGQPT